jgi:Cys-tRNA(Pro)/Cys-tRNA(Cys) deacylase
MEKTNVMRLLDVASIPYGYKEYDPEITDGESVASLINEPCERVFKTLVCVGGVKEYYVFVIPVNTTLDFKKASKAVNVKSIEMLKQKDLFSLTGYVHGGCSPIGMKKPFVTAIDETAILFDTIFVSAGKRGRQIQINPTDLSTYIGGIFADLTRD